MQSCAFCGQIIELPRPNRKYCRDCTAGGNKSLAYRAKENERRRSLEWKAKNAHKAGQVAAYQKAYRAKTAEKRKAYMAAYCQTPEYKARNKARRTPEYYKKALARTAARRKADPMFAIRQGLGIKMWKAFTGRGLRKPDSVMKFLGCTRDELRAHLARQFTLDMSFENYAKVWEIDHIIPCAAWDLTDPKQVAACFHYTNLAPAYVYDNRSKSDGRGKDWTSEKLALLAEVA